MKSLIFLLLLTAGCAAPEIVSTWTAPEAGRTAYQKILVVSIVPEDNSARGQMEQHLVGDLKAIGYNALAFHQQFNADEFRTMRYDSARVRFQRQGIDAVLLTSLMAKDTSAVYVENKAPAPANPMHKKDFWDYYTSVREAIGKPGYYVNATEWFWQSKLYDLQSLDLVYEVQSKAFNPASTESLAHQYGKKVVKDLVKHDVLAAKKE